MWKCPKCGETFPDHVSKCAFCDITKPTGQLEGGNYCINPNCSAYQKELGNATQKTCYVCEGLTRLGKMLKDML